VPASFLAQMTRKALKACFGFAGFSSMSYVSSYCSRFLMYLGCIKCVRCRVLSPMFTVCLSVRLLVCLSRGSTVCCAFVQPLPNYFGLLLMFLCVEVLTWLQLDLVVSHQSHNDCINCLRNDI